MISESRQPDTIAVAIGRNEGEKLRRCLTSLLRDIGCVVYVDSGSTDESVNIARELGVDVVELDTSKGFTAARARNTGYRRGALLAPDAAWVQFVDGDCEVVAGWVQKGLDFLRSHPQVAVVCGRRREAHPDRNIYHRLADMEWDTPSGQTHSCGGDAIFRREAIDQVGGYRDTLIAGEEPELCTRLRKNGWEVWRVDCEMTVHDIAMSKFQQWWKRTRRSGHAYAEVAALHGSLQESHRWRKLMSIWGWPALLLLGLGLWPWLGGLPLLVIVTASLFSVTRTSVNRVQKHGDATPQALLYAMSCLLAKWPQALGSLEYFWNRLRGSQSELMEYSSRAAAAPSHQPTGERARGEL